MKFPWNEPNRYNLNPWPMRLLLLIGLVIIFLTIYITE